MTDRIPFRIIKHELVPQCGSYEVRFADGQNSVFWHRGFAVAGFGTSANIGNYSVVRRNRTVVMKLHGLGISPQALRPFSPSAQSSICQVGGSAGILSREQALEQAKALARAERDRS